jgi:stalled ribosome alternative rescue factor ArfA
LAANTNLLKLHGFFSVDFLLKKWYYYNMMRKAVINIYAKQLADRKYQNRIVRARKGKGSYDRKRLEKKYA